MRRLVLFLALCLTFTTVSFAQSTKDQQKEREAIKKESRSAVNEKATKAARKEAKRMEKEGWKTAPGSLPLEKQLDRSYLMQYEYDDDNLPKYIIGEAMSTGGNYDAAKVQSMELARQNLASQIQSEVAGIIENTVSNKQLDESKANSITETVMASKSLITQSLGRIIPVVECYRDTQQGKEVRVVVAYSTNMAKQVTSRAIKEELEKKGQDLHNELDNALGLGKN